ncbi:hypothetical protein RSA36_20355 [Pantoea stewartii]|uniref:Uncharacterized protein n=1 Tax=Pantoea stewartii TaxID=66269 RepID=A0AB34VAZ7_9GAMM|nr:hypothetical protein RSA30_04660 [Pantoea stewartii]KTS93999.1 hypothetical protein RSA13_19845 [Pantoea stewartii]KTT05536.1 hypothetical protein RSA36_20355 [Pantoea stewartii]
MRLMNKNAILVTKKLSEPFSISKVKGQERSDDTGQAQHHERPGSHSANVCGMTARRVKIKIVFRKPPTP